MLFLIIFCIFCCTTYGSSTFYSKSMCQSNDSADCSFQIYGAAENSCKIYNTSVCKGFDFSRWSYDEYKYPKREFLSSFNISVQPYAGKYIPQQLYLLPAINITLRSVSKDINGFVLHLSETLQQKNICRIFDFRRVADNQRRNVSLFYDCMYFQHASRGKKLLVVRALPTNEELKYDVFVPEAEDSNANTLCQWKPLIMVSTQSLEENVIEVKFSKAREKFNVTAYIVTLYSALPDGDNTIVDRKSVKGKPHDEMLFVDFEYVDIGYYFVSIQPTHKDELCNETTTTIIFVPTKLFSRNIIMYISLLVAGAVIVTFAAQLFFRWSLKPKPLTSPNILVVHSYDFKEHDAAVAANSKILEHRGCRVNSIYGNGHPTEWLCKHFEEADVVVVVISMGVFHKIEKFNNPPLPEKHKWGDRLTPAISLIHDEIFSAKNRSKKIAKVFFDYSGTHHVPQKMKFRKWGETFALPKQLDDFICYVHNEKPRLCCPLIPMEGHFSSQEIKNLNDYIKAAKEVLLKKEISENSLTTSSFDSTEKAKAVTNFVEDKVRSNLNPIIFQVDQLNVHDFGKLKPYKNSSSGIPLIQGYEIKSDCNDELLKNREHAPCKNFIHQKDMWSILFNENS